ncbi:E3 ubiquitin-protein ligase TRIM33-like [Saccostrea echinata]|uniref:E3 ubiquitin-protein ligase TRIM33-like n=1 Tax=Saccostrea echinata TaxID=191078 RepID=UPI002A7F704D|nr:E3 ubiquitin-protein ligase TRIM33-like [Saccostrea echinata]
MASLGVRTENTVDNDENKEGKDNGEITKTKDNGEKEQGRDGRQGKDSVESRGRNGNGESEGEMNSRTGKDSGESKKKNDNGGNEGEKVSRVGEDSVESRGKNDNRENKGRKDSRTGRGSGESRGKKDNGENVSRKAKDPNTLKCSLCYETFKDPRLLECYHSFCKECLKYQIEAKGIFSSYECTVCGAVSKIPQNKEEGFPKNFFFFNKDGNAILKCDVCGEKTRAEFYCFVCDQNYCSFCLRVHSKLQGTKSHRIVTISEKGDRMISQSVSLCDHHTTQELKYFCVTCKQPICIDCNMTMHKSHECKDISEAVIEFRNSLESATENSEHRDFIEKLSNEKAKAKKEKNKMLDTEEKLLDNIREQAQLFHRLVDDIQDECSSKVLEYSPDNSAMKNVEKIKLQYLGLYEFSTMLLEQGNDIDIIIHGTKLTEMLEKVKNSTAKPPAKDNTNIDFVKGFLMKEKVRDLFGFISIPEEKEGVEEIRLVKWFDCEMEDTVITGISCVEDDKAWICMGNEGVAKLYDVKGKCHDTFVTDYKLDDIAYDGKGTVYLSCNARKMVVKKEGDTEPETFLRTKCCARGMTFDRNSNTLTVGLTEKDVFYNCSENPSASMVKMQNMKTEKKVMGRNTIQYPARIALNAEESWFVVSDWITLQVVLTDFEGNQLNSFDGEAPECMEESEFIPRGICCDSKGRIYVVNNGSNSVWRLTANGRFDKKIVDIDDCWSLACDVKNRLWIGTQTGKIFIFQV